MVAWCTHDALNHWNHTSALEQVHLSRIFLKDLCKRKALNGSLALVVGRGLYGDVRWVASLALLYTEESCISRVGRSQAQEDIEQRT